MAVARKKGLGKGLGNLIPDSDIQVEATNTKVVEKVSFIS